MLSEQLLDELRQLPPGEKLRIVQFLVNDLAAGAGEASFLSGAQYEVWSPYAAAGAAETLTQMLQDERKASDA